MYTVGKQFTALKIHADSSAMQNNPSRISKQHVIKIYVNRNSDTMMIQTLTHPPPHPPTHTHNFMCVSKIKQCAFASTLFSIKSMYFLSKTYSDFYLNVIQISFFYLISNILNIIILYTWWICWHPHDYLFPCSIKRLLHLPFLLFVIKRQYMVVPYIIQSNSAINFNSFGSCKKTDVYVN